MTGDPGLQGLPGNFGDIGDKARNNDVYSAHKLKYRLWNSICGGLPPSL